VLRTPAFESEASVSARALQVGKALRVLKEGERAHLRALSAPQRFPRRRAGKAGQAGGPKEVAGVNCGRQERENSPLAGQADHRRAPVGLAGYRCAVASRPAG